MSDPLARAAAHPPATLGEGCLSRYDPVGLTSENGAEFAGAAELWQQMQDALLLDVVADTPIAVDSIVAGKTR